MTDAQAAARATLTERRGRVIDQVVPDGAVVEAALASAFAEKRQPV